MEGKMMAQSIKAINSLVTAEESHAEEQGRGVSQTRISPNHLTQTAPTPPNEPLSNEPPSNFLGKIVMSTAEMV